MEQSCWPQSGAEVTGLHFLSHREAISARLNCAYAWESTLKGMGLQEQVFGVGVKTLVGIAAPHSLVPGYESHSQLPTQEDSGKQW